MLYNSEWLGKMTFADVILLASKYTVARILERDDFERRYKAGEPISVHELMYPLAQAMDSVAVQADIELGGTDQKFNLLVGRDIQREQGMDPQIAITLPILPGTDGVEKMSKSLDNYIAINESPAEMYGKTLSIPDPLIYDYYLLATDVPASDLRGIRTQLDGGTVNPMDLKRRLARELVRMYHNREAARAAEEDFNRKFRDKTTPTDLEEFRPVQEQLKNYITLTVATGSVESGSAARRLIESGGLYVDGQRIDDPFQPPPQHGTFILKIGKKVFWRIVIQEQPDKS
jgi:tyrosyl-tRNA synthetase